MSANAISTLRRIAKCGVRNSITKTKLASVFSLLAICRPSDRTVASGVVVVVVVVDVDVCNRSQMRTSKYTCLIFGVSVGLDPS